MSNAINLQKDNFENITKPFEGDCVNRIKLARQLTNYVDRLPNGATLALDAKWGEGKTWFVQHWKKLLKEENHKVIFIDAFKNDFMEDPFITICGEITSIIDQESTKQAFTKKAANAFAAVTPLLPKIFTQLALTTAGLGALGQVANDVANAIKENGAGTALTESIEKLLEQQIEKNIADYQTQHASLAAFKAQLQQIAQAQDKPLVFIIDELDRCKPDYAIQVLERIKHFFELPNIVFVLSLNKIQLSKCIEHQYGYTPEDGQAYLDKFIDFTIALETHALDVVDKYDTFIKDLMYNAGLITSNVDVYQQPIYKDCIYYCNWFKPSMRALKFLLNQYALLQNNINQDKQPFYCSCCFCITSIKMTFYQPKILYYAVLRVEFLKNMVKDIILMIVIA